MPFIVIPLVFFFVVRPIVWGSGYGFWCGPRWRSQLALRQVRFSATGGKVGTVIMGTRGR